MLRRLWYLSYIDIAIMNTTIESCILTAINFYFWITIINENR